jgi:isoleucyl-tRNA synthetase
MFKILSSVDFAAITNTSSSSITTSTTLTPGTFTLPEVPSVGVQVTQAEGEKCQRCWRILPEVGADPAHPDLCGRCADAVAALGVAAPVGGD